MLKRIVCLHFKKSVKDMNIESDVKIWLILIMFGKNWYDDQLEKI